MHRIKNYYFKKYHYHEYKFLILHHISNNSFKFFQNIFFKKVVVYVSKYVF